MKKIDVSRRRLLACVDEGMNLDQLSTEFSCCKSTIRRYISIYKIHTGWSRCYVLIDHNIFVNMWDSGASISSIRNEFGCSYKTVMRRVNKFNLRRREVCHIEETNRQPTRSELFELFCASIPPHPKWTRSLDKLLWRTGGCWSKMATFCKYSDKTMTMTKQRYHVIYSVSRHNHNVKQQKITASE